MARPDKVAVVDRVTEQFTEAAATLLTDYRGLTVGELAELRAELRKVDATYAVVKNTLTRIAAKNAGMEGLDEILVGPTALVFCGEDPVGPAKALKAFGKDHEALVFKGGYLDGAVLDAEAALKLADLESREDLLARLAGMMNNALAGFARLLQAPISDMARLMGALEADGGVEAKGFSPTAAEGAAAPAEEAPAEETPSDEDEAPAAAADDAESVDSPESDDSDSEDSDDSEDSPESVDSPDSDDSEDDDDEDEAPATGGAVASTATDAAAATGTVAEDVAETTAAAASGAAEAVADAAASAADAAPDAVAETAGDVAETVAEAADTAAETAASAAEGAAEAVADAASTVAEKVEEVVADDDTAEAADDAETTDEDEA